MSPSFLKMRQGLVDRGLIDKDFRITEAGMAYTDQLMDELRSGATPKPSPKIRSVRWAMQWPHQTERKAA